jgi:hypothetical protein
LPNPGGFEKTVGNTSYNSLLYLILKKFPTFDKLDSAPENPNGPDSYRD